MKKQCIISSGKGQIALFSAAGHLKFGMILSMRKGQQGWVDLFHSPNLKGSNEMKDNGYPSILNAIKFQDL